MSIPVVACPRALLAVVVALATLACGGDFPSPTQASRSAALRELSADRPDVTESPISVDAGHVQIESSLLEWTRDGGSDGVSLLPTNLKLGLSARSDVQFLFAPQAWENRDGPDGFSDPVVRYKRNLWGNDGGKTALGIMPFVKIPGGSDLSTGDPDAGIIVPFCVDLTDRAALGLMAEVDWIDAEGLEFLHTASVAIDLGADWGMYLEYAGILLEGGYLAMASTGLTYLVNPDLQLDAGLRAGLTGEADDSTLFTGFTIRF